MIMNRRTLGRLSLIGAVTFVGLGYGASVWAQTAAPQATPDGLIQRLSSEMLDTLRSDKSIKAGNLAQIGTLVDKVVMPHVNFQRMTASAVGPSWRKASAQQQSSLQTEFKALLIRTYAGALAQVTDQQIIVKPLRAKPEDNDVLVRTEIRGRGDPIQLDYRLEKGGDKGEYWKIYNLNVLGVWLVETYRNQFTQEINAKGIDGLITTLAQRNAAAEAKK